MSRASIVTSFIIAVSLLGALAAVVTEAQQGRQLTDFRGRSYTEEDLAKALFSDATSDVQTRGIGPARPQSTPANQPVVRPPVALNVFFEFNSDQIIQDYYSDMDKLGKVLSAPQYSAYRVQIEGHTDSIGSASYNQRLSERRAESVKRYLTQRFPIPSDRLVVRGFGKSKPITTNETPEGRDKNRRVEVVNLGAY